MWPANRRVFNFYCLISDQTLASFGEAPPLDLAAVASLATRLDVAGDDLWGFLETLKAIHTIVCEGAKTADGAHGQKS